MASSNKFALSQVNKNIASKKLNTSNFIVCQIIQIKKLEIWEGLKALREDPSC